MRTYKGIFFCDVDGTILPHGQKEVPREFFSLVDEADAAGYLFCISSGRFDKSLIRLFPGLTQKVVFSASNGCLVLYQDKVLLPSYTIDRPTAKEITNALLSWDAIPLISTTGAIYLPVSAYEKEQEKTYLAKGYNRFFSDFSQVEETVLQITAVCEDQKVAILEKARAAWGDRFEIFTTGKPLFDICPTNKGSSLVAVRNHFKIRREHTYAFGDDENDVSMLKEAGRGFVMDTAHEAVKSHGFEVCHDLFGFIRSLISKDK